MAPEKIVQSLITALKEESDKIESARQNLNDYKDKWVIHNPDIIGTALENHLTAVLKYLSDLNTLADSAVITVINNKFDSSHDIKGLD